MNQVPAVQIPPWRPTDREDIRVILGIPATENALVLLTSAMNGLADYSPDTVVSVQGWIDAWKALEERWNGVLAGGDIAAAYATEYEGLRPGAEVTREDMLKKADVLEWDTETQYKVRLSGGAAGSAGTLAGAIRDQMNLLAHKICTALAICHLMDGGGAGIGNGLLLRS